MELAYWFFPMLALYDPSNCNPRNFNIYQDVDSVVSAHPLYIDVS